ncbi:MAG: sugar ABC transporter permease [Gorillibacterium sp.]|nr:sugar ABC transporter permease [Gorillibacterium sp.]
MGIIGTFRREGYGELYLILLPAFLLLLLFKYIPMGGLIIAFQDFNIFAGVSGSEFVGFKHFHELFTSEEFYRILRNTLIINFYKLAFWVPLPVFIAILLNEVRRAAFKKFVQTTIYLPHFLSWVIVGGIFVNLLSSDGPVNDAIVSTGSEPIRFLLDPSYFRHVIVSSAMWKEVGWGTIVYLAAISGINPEMYEAAMIDGASKMKQLWYITLPNLASTMVLMTLLSLGNLLTNSFEQILIMYNAAVYDVADVIETYVFRIGIGQMQYSYTTAVGLFSGVVGFILVMSANAMSRKFLGKGIW